MKSYDSDISKIEEIIQLKGKTLLEVGCGDGRLTAGLADRTESIIAIDLDECSISAARRNVPGVNFLVGSGENLELANDVFDVVLFSYSLHHQNCAKALTEAQRVVKQDGKILIIEPTYDSEFTRLVSVFEKDEVSRLKGTLAFMTSGRFNILCKDSYCVDHLFADENQLYDYFMTTYMAAKDDRAVEKIQEIVGSKKEMRPICIRDEVNIFLIEGDPMR